MEETLHHVNLENIPFSACWSIQCIQCLSEKDEKYYHIIDLEDARPVFMEIFEINVCKYYEIKAFSFIFWTECSSCCASFF